MPGRDRGLKNPRRARKRRALRSLTGVFKCHVIEPWHFLCRLIHAASHWGDLHMRIGTFGKEASEKELAVRPSSKKRVSLKKAQKRAELLRRRIEELDGRLAILKSERGIFEKLLDGVRRMDDSRSSNPPTLWQRPLPR